MVNKSSDETEYLLASEENAKRLRESTAEFKANQKPTVYLSLVSGNIEISSYPFDHEDAEKYTMQLREAPFSSLAEAERQLIMLRNILEHSGVKVVVE